MKIEKAIEVLETLLTPDPQFSPELRKDAVRLGIEALKAMKNARSLVSRKAYRLLPGETED